jgi:hypothetical protein
MKPRKGDCAARAWFMPVSSDSRPPFLSCNRPERLEFSVKLQCPLGIPVERERSMVRRETIDGRAQCRCDRLRFAL